MIVKVSYFVICVNIPCDMQNITIFAIDTNDVEPITQPDMAFYKKMQKKINGLWYPQCITKGTASTKDIARYITQGTTVSPADVMAVLAALPSAMKHYMSLGQTVKLDNIGTFYYTAHTKGQGVASAEEVSADRIQGVHVRFTPGGSRRADNSYSERYLVSDDIEWIELPG